MSLKKQPLFVLLLLIIIFITTCLWQPQEPIVPKAQHVKACFVILIRNSELDGIVSTMNQIESTFNKKYEYPYVFLNNNQFTTKFKNKVKSSTKARVLFGTLDDGMWGYPSFINQTYAAERRAIMEKQGIPYATSESYRHMCR